VTGLTVPSLRPVALRAVRLAVVLWLVVTGTAVADDPTKGLSPEIDTNPPPGFETELRFLLHPIPCPVRAFALPDLFAGRMHAVLGRRWEGPVKGLDWCDLLWFAGGRPALQLSHLEARMVQGGDWPGGDRLTPEAFRSRLVQAIHSLDMNQARLEVAPFVAHPDAFSAWSVPFSLDVTHRDHRGLTLR
jgi:hypothetical protein